MSATNPYQIRLEILKLAKETVFEPVYAERDRLQQEYSAAKNVNDSAPFPQLPPLPELESVLKAAMELNKFVSSS